MTRIERQQLESLVIWVIVKVITFGTLNLGQNVLPIVIEANKRAMFIVNIDKVLYRLMTVFVFRISL